MAQIQKAIGAVFMVYLDYKSGARANFPLPRGMIAIVLTKQKPNLRSSTEAELSEVYDKIYGQNIPWNCKDLW